MKKARNKRFRNVMSMLIIWFVIIIGFIMIGSHLRNWLISTDDEVILEDIQNKYPGVSAELLALAKDDKNVRNILENYDAYEKDLLDALISNPEMSKFVLHSIDATHPKININEDLKKNKEPLLLQWDERWGYETYGDGYMALTGCGPTAMSMVLLALRANSTYDPWTVAQYSQNQGYYQAGVGTTWSLMSEGAIDLGLSVEVLSLNKNAMQEVLRDGGMIICSMKPGDFTRTGHFIVISGMTSNKDFIVKDPNSEIRSERTWSYEELKPQISNLWGYH